MIEDLTAPVWDLLDDPAAETAARRAADSVEGRFLGLRREETSRTALFSVSGLTMALVPGGTFELGAAGRSTRAWSMPGVSAASSSPRRTSSSRRCTAAPQGGGADRRRRSDGRSRR